jgi:hypothetical protein
VRAVAAQTGISKSSVQRYFQLFGLQPHRTEGFKRSNDPFFVEKLRNVVRLYLSPPTRRWSVRGREEPVPGAGANAADAAYGIGLRRRRHA